MKLKMDGITTEVYPEESLQQIAERLGLVTGKLSQDPLAAKIAGEVFTLRYIPVRQKDVSPERSSMRRAMAASGGVVQLLRYGDAAGREVYTRTAQFVIFLAIRQLWPEARAKMNCTVGAGLYIEVSGAADFDANRLKAQVAKIVAEDIPLNRQQMLTKDAIAHFEEDGQDDKASLLRYRSIETFSLYAHGDYADYFYGELAPSTGALKVWDILPVDGGFIK